MKVSVSFTFHDATPFSENIAVMSPKALALHCTLFIGIELALANLYPLFF
jgi:hypothetical protein